MTYKVLFIPLNRGGLYHFPCFLPKEDFSFPNNLHHYVFKTMMEIKGNSLLADYFFPVDDDLLKHLFSSWGKSILSKSQSFIIEPFHFQYNQGDFKITTCKGIYSGFDLEKQVNIPLEHKFQDMIKCGVYLNKQTILFHNHNNIYLYDLKKKEISQIPTPSTVKKVDVFPYGFLVSLYGRFTIKNHISRWVNQPLFFIKDNRLINIGYFDSYDYGNNIEWSFYARQPTTKNRFLRRKIDVGAIATFKHANISQIGNSLCIKIMGGFSDYQNQDYKFNTYIIIQNCEDNISLNTIQKQWDFFMDAWNTNGVILLQQKLKNSWNTNGEIHNHKKQLMYFEF